MGDTDEARDALQSAARRWDVPPWVAIAISCFALVVSVVGVSVAISQAHTAREQAATARDALKNTLTQQRNAQANKVSAVTNDDAFTLTVSNGSAQPIKYVTVYFANDEGVPAVEWNLEDPLAGCTATTWTLSTDQVLKDMVITFDDANGVEWLLPVNGGLARHSPDTSNAAEDIQTWPEKQSRVATCS